MSSHISFQTIRRKTNEGTRSIGDLLQIPYTLRQMCSHKGMLSMSSTYSNTAHTGPATMHQH